MPSVLLKSDEWARPTPLSGLAVNLSDEEFVFRMSDFAELNDRVRDLRAVLVALPLIYTNQHRVIIAIEKGEPGQRALEKAFAACGL